MSEKSASDLRLGIGYCLLHKQLAIHDIALMIDKGSKREFLYLNHMHQISYHCQLGTNALDRFNLPPCTLCPS